MTGIREMFAELSGYERYEYALAVTLLLRQQGNYANVKRWRKANPEKFRIARKRWTYRWEERHPERARAAKRRYTETHREKMREIWKNNQRAKRARDRAARELALVTRACHLKDTP